MKTKLLAGVIAACFAAPAFAQSSVTMYGIADAGFVYQRTGGSPSVRIASGIADGSRLGFKGSEDIGGGYKAIFNLEARVELDTGTQQPTLLNDAQGLYLTKGMGALPPTLLKSVQGALQVPNSPAVNTNKALFDRTSMVGLITPAGAFLLGRMYTPGYEVFAAGDTFESGTAGQWGNITGGTAGFTALGADIRSDKAFQYRIATPTGFGAALMYGVKNSGYLGLYNRFLGMNLTYKANGLDVGFGHNRGTDSNDLKSLTTTTLAGSYTVGAVKLFAGVHDQKNPNSALLKTYIGAWDGSIAPSLAPLGAATAAALRNIFVTNITKNTQVDALSYTVGMHYTVGSGRVMGSISHQNDRSASNNDATQFAIGYDYNLSKRTDIYSVASSIHNNNEAQYAQGIAGSPGGFTSALGGAARAFNFGMRHRF